MHVCSQEPWQCLDTKRIKRRLVNTTLTALVFRTASLEPIRRGSENLNSQGEFTSDLTRRALPVSCCIVSLCLHTFNLYLYICKTYIPKIVGTQAVVLPVWFIDTSRSISASSTMYKLIFYICIFTRTFSMQKTHICTNIYISTNAFANKHTCVCAYMYIHACVCMYVCCTCM